MVSGTVPPQVYQLEASLPQLVLKPILYWTLYLTAVLLSRSYIQQRGKQLGLSWFQLYRWRMAALFLGPVAALLFFLGTRK